MPQPASPPPPHSSTPSHLYLKQDPNTSCHRASSSLKEIAGPAFFNRSYALCSEPECLCTVGLPSPILRRVCRASFGSVAQKVR